MARWQAWLQLVQRVQPFIKQRRFYTNHPTGNAAHDTTYTKSRPVLTLHKTAFHLHPAKSTLKSYRTIELHLSSWVSRPPSRKKGSPSPYVSLRGSYPQAPNGLEADAANPRALQLIDFSKFLAGTPEERAETAAAILHGFKTAGFIYLRNHPVPAATVRDVFARSADFFAQPLEDKAKLSLTDPAANRGYLRQGREKLIPPEDGRASEGGFRKEVVELKESFEIGREPHDKYQNHWPEAGKVDGFREQMVAFFDGCKDLHMQVMRAIAMGLGLEESHFDGFVDLGDNTLRLLHYPQVEADVFKSNVGQVRAGEHCVSPFKHHL